MRRTIDQQHTKRTCLTAYVTILTVYKSASSELVARRTLWNQEEKHVQSYESRLKIVLAGKKSLL